MFQVRASHILGDDWEKVCLRIGEIAGEMDFAGFNIASGLREYGWVVPSLKKATDLRRRLVEVPGVLATIREHTS